MLWARYDTQIRRVVCQKNMFIIYFYMVIIKTYKLKKIFNKFPETHNPSHSQGSIYQHCIHWFGLVQILQHFRGFGTCYMLPIIYIYFYFTMTNIRLRTVHIAHFATMLHVDEIVGVLLRISWAGLQVKVGPGLNKRQDKCMKSKKVKTERVDFRLTQSTQCGLIICYEVDEISGNRRGLSG